MSTGNPFDSLVAHAQAWAADHPETPAELYALIDAGLDKNVWKRLSQKSQQTQSLLSTKGGAADAFSPHLAALGSATEPSPELKAVLALRHPTAAYTLVCSNLPFEELHAHFSRFVEIKLAGGIEMLLAFWDPAILGTLLGQASDDSLHVPGPVLSAEQRATLLSPVVAWWYCDRESRWHRVDCASAAKHPSEPVLLPFTLTQSQEDMLVEASVPDQVLYHLELNQPNLFEDTQTHEKRYGFVKIVLGSARKLGLNGMRDLVNFTALCLIYRRRMQTDPAILRLLDQVQRKSLTLDEAMPLMPE
jgi:hypothetical protein